MLLKNATGVTVGTKPASRVRLGSTVVWQKLVTSWKVLGQGPATYVGSSYIRLDPSYGQEWQQYVGTPGLSVTDGARTAYLSVLAINVSSYTKVTVDGDPRGIIPTRDTFYLVAPG